MLGLKRSSLIKQPLSLFISKDNQDTLYLHCRQVFKTKTRQVCELKMVTQNHTQFEVQLESIARQDSDGTYRSFRTTIIDIT